jgi:universal stress protein A
MPLVEIILVPLDFSDCSHHLVQHASGLAQQLGARLRLLHVYEAPRGLSLKAELHPSAHPEGVRVESWVTEDVERRMPVFDTIAREANVGATHRLAFGEVAPTILAVAEEEKVDMILMGTHGRSGVIRAWMGSVAEAVLREATVPVMTLRTQHHPGCKATSCAVCSLGKTPVEKAILGEVEG